MTARDPRPGLLADLRRTNENLRGHRRKLAETIGHIERLERYRSDLLADLALYGLADTPEQVAALIAGA